jgi:uroporphyrinogen III methyltransferase/synthase
VTVYLVGAGPGDPGLITVRGAELLARADVVVHDRLSAAELLDLAPPQAERIDVGKRPGGAGPSQTDIDQLLVDRGRSGATVVRLKGGDPFVFARGGEEAAALEAAGVDYEVVPGITSAIAVPSYAGIPVTRRFSSTSVTIVTGHEDPAKDEPSVDWRALARTGGTLVILMGAARIGAIADELIAGGLPASTPAAAVRWGTRPTQRTIRSTLGDIGAAGVRSPATIVVGDVAAERLDWFERRPLFGLTVVNPRAREQASELTARLTAKGAAVVELASIEIGDPADGGAALREAVERLASFDWVVLTSANGARRFCAAVGDARRLAGVRLAAIGPGTAAVLADHFLTVDLVPPSYVAESLLGAFDPGPGRVLLPRAAVARDVLPDGLRARGWDVEVVEAYRTTTPTPDAATLERVATADVVAFTASSTVTRFLELAGAERLPRGVAAIGPITAATARDHGLVVDVEATDHSLDGLVAAIERWAAGARPVGSLAEAEPAPPGGAPGAPPPS